MLSISYRKLKKICPQKIYYSWALIKKKHPQTVLDAYNDPKGLTEDFNKNLFVRMNEEFDANFDLDSFFHWETYDPETGTAKSFLVSNKAQQIKIPKLELTVDFKAWETIHTEISQKIWR